MIKASQKRGLLLLVQLGFIAAAAALVFAFITASREGELRRRCTPVCALQPRYVGADRRAPDFRLRDLSGRAVGLNDYGHKVIVLNFWTKTCAPCLEEMPTLAELGKILRTRPDVALVTVSTDEGPDAVRDTLHTVLREEPPFAVLFDPEAKVVRDRYGTHLYPETWIIDKRGVIRARFDGAQDWSSPIIVEFIDQVRAGSYCPVVVKDGRASGEAAAFCDDTTGG